MKFEELSKTPKIGSKVTMRQSTENSFDEGDVITITGFKDDDPNKILTEGVLPGGWIPKEKIYLPTIPLRFMTPLEMLVHTKNAREFFPSVINKYTRNLVSGGGALDMSKVGNFKKFDNSDFGHSSCNMNGGRFDLYCEMLLPADSPKLDYRGFELKIMPEFHVDVESMLLPTQLNGLLPKVQEFFRKYTVAAANIDDFIIRSILGPNISGLYHIKFQEETWKLNYYLKISQLGLYKDGNMISPGHNEPAIIVSLQRSNKP